MSDSGYKIRNQEAIHFITLTIVNWIDLFTRPIYREVLIDSLKYCQKKKGLIIYAYVIMSNHVHLIVKSETGSLSNIIRDFKSYTSKQFLEVVKESSESRKEWLLWMFEKAAKRHSRNTNYQVWTHDNHPEELESTKFLKQKLDYIHMNPVRASVVQSPEEYLHSSAGFYAELPGLIELTLLE